jgi:hypothetical protein
MSDGNAFSPTRLRRLVAISWAAATILSICNDHLDRSSSSTKT